MESKDTCVRTYVAFFDGITAAHFDVWTGPDSDATRDLAATDPLTKTLGKHHGESLHPSVNARFAPGFASKVLVAVCLLLGASGIGVIGP